MTEQRKTEPVRAYGNTVVVGVDGSPEAIVAARYAVRQATLRRLDVLLVYSYPLPSMDMMVGGGVIDGFDEAGRTVLDDALAALDVPAGVDVRTELGETLPILLLQPMSMSARLVVVGQHVTTWFDRLGRGSVASPLAHHSGCPLVVVPPGWDETRQVGRPVLVAMDGEVDSSASLRFALDEAELLGAEVVVLHVVGDQGVGATELAARNIAELVAGVRAERPGVAVSLVTTQGDPRQEILAKARDAALLVVGPPHTRALATWTRSLARRVMTDVGCPLVVVPRRWRGAPAPVAARPEALVVL